MLHLPLAHFITRPCFCPLNLKFNMQGREREKGKNTGVPKACLAPHCRAVSKPPRGSSSERKKKKTSKPARLEAFYDNRGIHFARASPSAAGFHRKEKKKRKKKGGKFHDAVLGTFPSPHPSAQFFRRKDRGKGEKKGKKVLRFSEEIQRTGCIAIDVGIFRGAREKEGRRKERGPRRRDGRLSSSRTRHFVPRIPVPLRSKTEEKKKGRKRGPHFQPRIGNEKGIFFETFEARLIPRGHSSEGGGGKKGKGKKRQPGCSVFSNHDAKPHFPLISASIFIVINGKGGEKEGGGRKLLQRVPDSGFFAAKMCRNASST